MARTYIPAKRETIDFVHNVLTAEYPSIAQMQPSLQIGVLFAETDKPGKPALTKGGLPITAQIRVVSEEGRAAGGPDVLLVIDSDRWTYQSNEERYSLIHHELHHLIPVNLLPALDGGSCCEIDSLGRPKIKIRKHDFEIGGFNLIVERYGDSSAEWKAVKQVYTEYHQTLLPFAVDQEKEAS